MVANTGAAPRPSGIRPLDAPQPVQVDVDGGDMPAGVRLKPVSRSHTPARRQVLQVLDTWRIEDEWWRKRPVSRLYYRVLLEDGTVTGLFKDLVGGDWYSQRV